MGPLQPAGATGGELFGPRTTFGRVEPSVFSGGSRGGGQDPGALEIQRLGAETLHGKFTPSIPLLLDGRLGERSCRTGGCQGSFSFGDSDHGGM